MLRLEQSDHDFGWWKLGRGRLNRRVKDMVRAFVIGVGTDHTTVEVADLGMEADMVGCGFVAVYVNVTEKEDMEPVARTRPSCYSEDSDAVQALAWATNPK